mmetsp:Transcript_12327/g.29492  ORF Transcript_12327/g.29492 Transcript_12327/m.29492 type:complete len:222 (+) Transcript_12327:694-1359(+)
MATKNALPRDRGPWQGASHRRPRSTKPSMKPKPEAWRALRFRRWRSETESLPSAPRALPSPPKSSSCTPIAISRQRSGSTWTTPRTSSSSRPPTSSLSPPLPTAGPCPRLLSPMTDTTPPSFPPPLPDMGQPPRPRPRCLLCSSLQERSRSAPCSGPRPCPPAPESAHACLASRPGTVLERSLSGHGRELAGGRLGSRGWSRGWRKRVGRCGTLSRTPRAI